MVIFSRSGFCIFINGLGSARFRDNAGNHPRCGGTNQVRAAGGPESVPEK